MTTAGTAAARHPEHIDVSRIAASGEVVELTLPAAVGDLRWYGSTRLTGPRTTRQFFLAPAGEHRSIPARLMPGARRLHRSLRRTAGGFEAVVYEAVDRSDSALVLIGPFHEATTWFGGPAPDAADVERLLRTVRFADAANGATLVPATDLLRQPDVALIGRSAGTTLVVRRAGEARPAPREWAGSTLPDGELWRARAVDQPRTRLVDGGSHRWRYVHAGAGVDLELVFLGPESGRSAVPLRADQLARAMSVVTGRWAA